MAALITLMLTWTDIFNWIGKFSYWVFSIMRNMGHVPNVIISATIIFLLGYWSIKILQQDKEAERNGTYK